MSTFFRNPGQIVVGGNINIDSVTGDVLLETGAGIVRARIPNSGSVSLEVTGNINLIGGGQFQTAGTPIFASGGIFVDKEVPTGVINGVNVTFTLASTPQVGSEHVFLNGELQNPGGSNDYTISGSTITFNVAPPTSTSALLVDYRK